MHLLRLEKGYGGGRGKFEASTLPLQNRSRERDMI